MNKLSINYLSINKIIKSKNNARKHSPEQLNQIKYSIEKFDFTNPILIDEKNIIIAGHGRLEAAKLANIKEIPTIVLKNLTETEKKAYSLADNRIAENSTWNINLLQKEMEAIKINIPDFNFENIGYDDKFIDYHNLFENEEIQKADKIPIDNEILKTKINDIWILGQHRLMCADCTTEKNIIKLMDNQKNIVAFIDPPYGINIVKNNLVGNKNFGTIPKGIYKNIDNDNTTNVAEKSFNILNSIGVKKMIIWGGNYFSDFLQPSNSWIVWDKRRDKGGINSFADAELAWTNFTQPIRIFRQLWMGMYREKEKEKRLHPTQKPVYLLSEIIKFYIKKNNIILDTFLGSGSTLIACEKISRCCFGMEIKPYYCDVIIKRWQNFTGKNAIRKKDGKSFNEI